MHLGRSITHESLLSQSVCQFSVDAISDGLKKVFNGQIFCLKWRLKRLLLPAKRLLQILLGLKKKLCTFLSSTKHPFEGHEIL